MSVYSRLREVVVRLELWPQSGDSYDNTANGLPRLEQEEQMFRDTLVRCENSVRAGLSDLLTVQTRVIRREAELDLLNRMTTRARRLSTDGSYSHVGFSTHGTVFQVDRARLSELRSALSAFAQPDFRATRDRDGNICLDTLFDRCSPNVLQVIVDVQNTGEIPVYREGFNEAELRKYADDFELADAVAEALQRHKVAKRLSTASAWAEHLSGMASDTTQWVHLSSAWCEAYAVFLRTGLPPGPCRTSGDDTMAVRASVATLLMERFGQTGVPHVTDEGEFAWCPAGVLQLAPRLPTHVREELRNHETFALVGMKAADRYCFVREDWCLRYKSYLAGGPMPGAITWADTRGVAIGEPLAHYLTEIHGADAVPPMWKPWIADANAFTNVVDPLPEDEGSPLFKLDD